MSRGAVVSAVLSERKVAGSVTTISDFHIVDPCTKAVFACLATDVKYDTCTFISDADRPPNAADCPRCSPGRLTTMVKLKNNC